MSNVDTRQVHRDSLFLLARLRVDGRDEVHNVKVRNLSAGGMMAEGPVKVARGTPVTVELRNLGWVDGAVAWKQDDRFGIAFVEEIDPRQVRASGAAESAAFESPRYTRTQVQAPPGQRAARDGLRKI